MSEAEKVIILINDYVKDKPIEKVWLFGSFARGEQKPSSDIDLLIVFNKSISLLEHAKYIIDLEDLLQRRVDLVSEETILPEIKSFVNKDRILIYERRT